MAQHKACINHMNCNTTRDANISMAKTLSRTHATNNVLGSTHTGAPTATSTS
jgi:hypothetical protein